MAEFTDQCGNLPPDEERKELLQLVANELQ
jgi:hypothetical protein